MGFFLAANEMSNKTQDTSEKESLKQHLPFINEMLEKFKGTKSEEIWQRMFKLIISDTQK